MLEDRETGEGPCVQAGARRHRDHVSFRPRTRVAGKSAPAWLHCCSPRCRWLGSSSDVNYLTVRAMALALPRTCGRLLRRRSLRLESKAGTGCPGGTRSGFARPGTQRSNVGGVIRAFGTFSSAAEYAAFLGDRHRRGSRIRAGDEYRISSPRSRSLRLLCSTSRAAVPWSPQSSP